MPRTKVFIAILSTDWGGKMDIWAYRGFNTWCYFLCCSLWRTFLQSTVLILNQITQIIMKHSIVHTVTHKLIKQLGFLRDCLFPLKNSLHVHTLIWTEMNRNMQLFMSLSAELRSRNIFLIIVSLCLGHFLCQYSYLMTAHISLQKGIFSSKCQSNPEAASADASH